MMEDAQERVIVSKCSVMKVSTEFVCHGRRVLGEDRVLARLIAVAEPAHQGLLRA